MVGLKGLLRKLFLMIVVAAAYQVDKMLGTTFLRDAVAIAFICNEALSLIENAGLMGIPIPQVLLRGIEALKHQASTDEEIPHDKPPDQEDGGFDGEEGSE